MKECVLISTEDCIKCKFIKPHLEKWCNENWYKFREKKYSDKMSDITSVPSAKIWNDVILNNEWILELITAKKKFY